MNPNNMLSDAIHVNIWDDYHDDGFVPEGEIQETYAYVEENDLTDENQYAVLLQLQQTIDSIKHKESSLTCNTEWYDVEEVYPNLIGTEHDICLYKRWQLHIKNLSHKEREDMIIRLGNVKIEYNGRPIMVYSES